jgi:peptide/nickel transport system substrate-binding protein
MRNKKLTSIIMSVCLILLFCVAAAKQNPKGQTTNTGKSANTAKPQYGGILKIINATGLVNLGYPGEQFRPNDAFYARPAVENLVGMDPKGTGKPVPQLAVDWKMAPDRKSIVFQLRKGVKFHDGTDFNAEAVKFNLETAMKGNRPELKGVAEVDVVDDYTVRLNFTSLDPTFLNNLSTGRAGMIVSPASLKKLGKDAMLYPVGTGPFKFVNYQRDVSLKYEKFNGYWQKGKPYLDGIEFLFVANATSAVLSFKAGEAQIIRRLAPNEADDLKKSGYSVVSLVSSISGLAGDSKNTNSPFSNLKVRQAVAHAIDSKAIVEGLFYGFYSVTNQWAAPGNYGFDAGVKGYSYDVKKAKQLLKEAGYANGFQTKILFEMNPFNQSLYSAIQSYLAAVGIDAKLDPCDSARFTQLRITGWDNAMVDFGISYSNGFDFGAALKDKLSSKASAYVSIASPADYDARFSQAVSETDPKKRETQFKQLSRIIIDTYSMAIPIFVRSSIIAKNSQVRDLDLSQYSHEWLPEDVWLSK